MKISALKYHIGYCRLNERDSQKKLYNSYFNEAKLVCQQYTEDEQEVTTIIKEGFRRVFNRINDFKPETGNWASSFDKWLKKMMIHSAIDHLRNHYRPDIFVELNSTVIATSITIQGYTGAPSATEIESALRRLSPASRTFLKLALIEMLDYRDIAECLNIPVETAEVCFLKARNNLQKQLSA